MPKKPDDDDADGNRMSRPTVRFDDSEIRNGYANVCNVSSAREEIVLSFGMNDSWERKGREVTVKLHSRVILSPFGAKRLALLLNSAVRQYESRFGEIAAEGAQAETRPA